MSLERPEAPPRSAPPPVPDHELIRRIGEGSYGEVWLARNVMGAFRAVKIVYRDSFTDERPFLREFTGIQKFEPISRSHDSQVDILHVGKTDGCFYYVMELADDAEHGTTIYPDRYEPRTLRTELSRQGRLPIDECLRIGIALATALDHLHQHGLVHRDIKPSNIIFVNDVPKLADIGLVASLDETRSFVGTEGFFPPEGPGTPQADLYSFGKVLYEMCTGLDRQDFPDLPTQLVDDKASDRLLELNAVIAKACRSDPAERYQSAREMLADLSLLQSGKSVRRLHTLEKRLARFTTVGVAAVVIGVVMLAAFLFQRHQTRAARELARENRRLADESRRHLVRLQTANGSRMIEQRDPISAALWYVENLKVVQTNSPEDQLQRMRLEWILNDAPFPERVFAHEGSVNVARFSPDERRIVTASDDRTARIWDAGTGEPLSAPLEHNGQRVVDAAFSPDGALVATAGLDGRARLWDGRTGAVHGEPMEHSNTVTRAVFSPAGDYLLTASYDGTARIWDARSGAPVTGSLRHKGPILCAEYSANGEEVVTGSTDNTAKLWDASSGVLKQTLRHEHKVDHAAFSRDGTRVVTATGTGRYAQFWVWEARTGERLLESARFTANGIGFVRFSPDEKAIILGCAPLVICDSQTGKPLMRPLDHGALRTISFSGDGKHAATGSERDSLAYVWEVANGRNVFAPLKHGGYVNSVQFSSDGAQLLTASDDGAARVWNLRPRGNSPIVFSNAMPVWDASFSPDGRKVIAALANGEARVWDLASRELSFPELVNPGPIAEAKFSANGSRILLSPTESTPNTATATNVTVWDAVTGKLVGRPIRHPTNVTAAAISADGGFVVTATAAGVCRVWDASSGRPASAPLRHTRPVTHVVFSPNGRQVLSTSESGWAIVWDWKTNQRPFYPVRHNFAVQYATYSRDGRFFATVSRDQTGRVWDAVTGEPVTPPFKHRGNVFFAAFSPDDRWVVSCGLSHRARIWDAKNGEQVLPALEHELAVTHAAFNPRAPMLLTGSADKTARLWDLITGEPLVPSLVHPGEIRRVDFSFDGRRFLTACADGNVRVWELPAGEAAPNISPSSHNCWQATATIAQARSWPNRLHRSAQSWFIESSRQRSPIRSPEGSLLQLWI